MKPSETITELLKQRKEELCRKFGVKDIGVFGSYARGEEHLGSDVDILVEFKEGCSTFDNYMDLKFFLQTLFNRRIDLVTVRALRPQLKESILREVRYA